MKKLTTLLLTIALYLGLSAQTNYYVDASRPDNSGDGLSWATAKKTNQAAVDLTSDGDVVNVNDGTYNVNVSATPGIPTTSGNRLVITTDITVQSVNGAGQTIIEGAEATGGGRVRTQYGECTCRRAFWTV